MHLFSSCYTHQNILHWISSNFPRAQGLHSAGYIMTTEGHGTTRKHDTYYILALRAETIVRAAGEIRHPNYLNHVSPRVCTDLWTSLNNTEPRIYLFSLPCGQKSQLSKPISLCISWDSLDLSSEASRRYYIPRSRVNPCASVVGNIPPCPAGRNLNYLNQFLSVLVGIV